MLAKSQVGTLLKTRGFKIICERERETLPDRVYEEAPGFRRGLLV